VDGAGLDRPLRVLRRRDGADKEYHSASYLGLGAMSVALTFALLMWDAVDPEAGAEARLPPATLWIGMVLGGLFFFGHLYDCLRMVVRHEDHDGRRLGRRGLIAGCVVLPAFLAVMHWLRPGPATDPDATEVWFRAGTGLLVICVVTGVGYLLVRFRQRSPRLIVAVTLLMAAVGAWYALEGVAARADPYATASPGVAVADEAERDVYEDYRFSIAGPGEGEPLDIAETEAAFTAEYELDCGEAYLTVFVDVAPGRTNSREEVAEYLRGLGDEARGATTAAGRLGGLECAIIEEQYTEGGTTVTDVMYYVPGTGHDYYIEYCVPKEERREHEAELRAIANSFECW
jgi:hypothetical protein